MEAFRAGGRVVTMRSLPRFRAFVEGLLTLVRPTDDFPSGRSGGGHRRYMETLFAHP